MSVAVLRGPDRRVCVFTLRTLPLLLLLPMSLWADSLTVDCTGATPGAFTTIAQALASLPLNSPTEPHTIAVTGTCTEVVNLHERERITIEAPPGQSATIMAPAPNAFGVFLDRSRAITLRRLVLSGARIGLFLDRSSEASIEDCVIENGGRGIVLFQLSSISFQGANRVQNNTGTGITFDEGSTGVISGVIENNGGSGIRLTTGSQATVAATIRGNGTGISLVTGSSVRLAGSNTIEDNGPVGVQVVGSSLSIEQFGPGFATIQGHTESGLSVIRGGSGSIQGPHLIQNNGSPAANPVLRAGIRISRGSVTVAGGAQIVSNDGPGVLLDTKSDFIAGTVTISNNTEEGVRILRQSVAGLFPPLDISSNGIASITCDVTSLVFGDLSSVRDIDCKNVEHGKGPPRPMH